MTIIEKIEQYSIDGYEISMEVGGSYYNEYLTTEQRADPEMFGSHYVNLFYGDSNGLHKPGTKEGTGHGFTLEEAFDAAVKNLKLINGV
jgi:hypothetical protein